MRGSQQLRDRLEPSARRLAKEVLSSSALHPYYRRVGRRFGRIYHNLGKHTWEGNTRWMGVGVEKLPLDLWIAQEIIFETRPDVVIETGVRRGGSTFFYAQLFDLIGEGRVLGIDIDLGLVADAVREHPRVTLLAADSAGDEAVRAAREAAGGGSRAMVILDSDHSARHVRRELDALAPFVSPGCYLIVEDTNLSQSAGLRLVDPGPLKALDEWLPGHPEFEVDPTREKFLATFNPRGFVRRRSD
jgi:cephalosporin hydroxylase